MAVDRDKVDVAGAGIVITTDRDELKVLVGVIAPRRLCARARNHSKATAVLL
jgi:hypothetical protein